MWISMAEASELVDPRVVQIGTRGSFRITDSAYVPGTSSFLANASHTVGVDEADVFPYSGPVLAAIRSVVGLMGVMGVMGVMALCWPPPDRS